MKRKEHDGKTGPDEGAFEEKTTALTSSLLFTLTIQITAQYRFQFTGLEKQVSWVEDLFVRGEKTIITMN